MDKGTLGKITSGTGTFGKGALGISFLLSLMLFSFANIHALGKYYIDEPFTPGIEKEAFFTVRNTIGEKLEDVTVKVYFYDLGLIYGSNTFDISKRDSTSAMMNIQLPRSVPEGVYLAKVSASNDNFRDTQHVWVSVY
ncbi:hypothetical protein HYU14_04660 [Candidatus Woesearchaeota archaeon]|nr:hypothetical protein [Candidatus Woesearchaeota archaeon]